MSQQDSTAILRLEIRDGMCYFKVEGNGEALKILEFLPAMYDSVTNSVNDYLKEHSTLQ